MIISGGVEPGHGVGLRAGDRLADRRAHAQRARSPTACRRSSRLAPVTGASGGTVPAGSAIFAADPATKNRLSAAGRAAGLRFLRVSGALPALEPIERVPRIAVFANAADQNLWSLRNLGFVADPVGTTLLNAPAREPAGELRHRVQRGRLAERGERDRADAADGVLQRRRRLHRRRRQRGRVPHERRRSRPGSPPRRAPAAARSGIVYWNNTGGAASPITGAYPATRHRDHGSADLAARRSRRRSRSTGACPRPTSSPRACGSRTRSPRPRRRLGGRGARPVGLRARRGSPCSR